MAFAPSILSGRTAERLDRMLSTREIHVQSPEQPGVRQVTIVEVIGAVGTEVWSPCKVRVIKADGYPELHSAECQFSDPNDTVYAPGQALWAMRCGSDPYGKPRYLVTGLPAGKFKLKAWVDEKTTLEREVELKDGTTARVDFSGK